MELLEKMIALENEAAEFGFQWESAEQILEQIQSECVEVSELLKPKNVDVHANLQEEIGDLLHAVLSLSLFCNLDPKETLQQAVDKFERRFGAVKEITQEKGLKNLRNYSFDGLMSIWSLAKKRTE